ncbi:MAG: Uma2 family endonuclease [Planctomycetes bacterium]|nr:Uma2 family endonuclease [Planctomycetota bacterium]
MVSINPRTITTAEQLYSIPDDGNRRELVEGVLSMMSPAGCEHGRIAGRIFLRLATHVEQHALGETYAAETGFRISESPDTVRAPDAAFVSRGRLEAAAPTAGFLSLAPDLVVEVVSPNDSFSSVEAKAADWLRAGCQVVLVADPGNSTIHVYESGSGIRLLRSGDRFSAGPVCGGWSLDVDDAFGVSRQVT